MRNRPEGTNVALNPVRNLGETSLSVGEYEDLKRAALDPYVSLRNAYFQHRRHMIEDQAE